MTNEKKKKIKKIFFFFFFFFFFFSKVRGPWGVFTRFQFSVAVCQTALGCSCSRYCFAAYFGVLRPQASIGPVFGGCCFCQRRPPLFVVVVRFALGVSCVVGYSKRTPRFYPVRFFFLLFYDSVFAFPPTARTRKQKPTKNKRGGTGKGQNKKQPNFRECELSQPGGPALTKIISRMSPAHRTKFVWARKKYWERRGPRQNLEWRRRHARFHNMEEMRRLVCREERMDHIVLNVISSLDPHDPPPGLAEFEWEVLNAESNHHLFLHICETISRSPE